MWVLKQAYLEAAARSDKEMAGRRQSRHIRRADKSESTSAPDASTARRTHYPPFPPSNSTRRKPLLPVANSFIENKNAALPLLETAYPSRPRALECHRQQQGGKLHRHNGSRRRHGHKDEVPQQGTQPQPSRRQQKNKSSFSTA